MFAENVGGKKSAYPRHEKDLADDGDAIRYLNKMHNESIEIFRALTDEDLQKKCLTPGDVPVTTSKWLRAMCEHEIHHRGQIYAYLGMLGVAAPPIFGLTSEQVREKSK